MENVLYRLAILQNKQKKKKAGKGIKVWREEVRDQRENQKSFLLKSCHEWISENI